MADHCVLAELGWKASAFNSKPTFSRGRSAPPERLPLSPVAPGSRRALALVRFPCALQSAGDMGNASINRAKFGA